MVPGRRPLTPLRRRALLALLGAAAIVWLLARQDGTFTIVGLEGEAASALGPLLPALSAGITVALALVIVDVVGGPVVAVLTAIALLLLPDFVPLHRTSLLGPPLLATTVAMLAVMLAAPRFSLAYGTIAAVGAVWIAPAGGGLVLAAVGWALWQPPNGRGRAQRAWLSLLPLLVVLLLTPWVGHGWPAPLHLAWHGGLDRLLGAIGGVIAAQQVPALEAGALRWFVVADSSLVLLAVIVAGWRRAVATAKPDRPRRFFPAVALLAVSLVTGLLVTGLLVVGMPLPGRSEAMALPVLATMAVAVSSSLLWPRWRWWGKGIALLCLAGWMVAAFTSR